MSLIDRQQAIDTIMGQPPEPHYPSWYAEQIKALPPAQPEIVRCKDCKHYKLSSLKTGHMACHYVIGATVVRKPDDFCSRAERKDGEVDG